MGKPQAPAGDQPIPCEQAVDRLPGWRGQQDCLPAQRRQRFTQGDSPMRLVGQQDQTQRFDRLRQAGSLRRNYSHNDITQRMSDILPQGW